MKKFKGWKRHDMRSKAARKRDKQVRKNEALLKPPVQLLSGEIGTIEGVRYIESPTHRIIK